MSDYLTWKEKMDLRRLLRTFHSVVDKYSADEASYHSPHAVSDFCHTFYHECYEEELARQARELSEALEAGEEVEGVIRTPDGGVALTPRHVENAVRQALEMAMLIGIEHGRRGHSPTECRCAQAFSDDVEAMLRSGKWGHA